MAAYQIFTDATADLPVNLTNGTIPVTIIPMQVTIGKKEYTYAPDGTLSVKEFYRLQRDGNFGTTSQINPSVYFQYFEPCLCQGTDILYLCFSSGMSGTIHAANLCVDELHKKYPERKIVCIDTLCASVGEGLLVKEAAKKQEAGFTLDELTDWVLKYRLQVCHWFTVDTFDHLRHGGRVSSAAAAVGTALQIKPLLRVDENGSLQVKEKPRGRKKAISALISKMEQGWKPELGNTVFIGHGDNPEAADQLYRQLALRFPEADIYIADIGPIIGTHTGPGMTALVYWGNTR